jgi:hypothetical protein
MCWMLENHEKILWKMFQVFKNPLMRFWPSRKKDEEKLVRKSFLWFSQSNSFIIRYEKLFPLSSEYIKNHKKKIDGKWSCNFTLKTFNEIFLLLNELFV